MIFRIIAIFILFLTLEFPQVSLAQKTTEPPTTKEAKDNFNLGNYHSALKEYLALLKTEPENPMYNFRVGVCYINTYIDRSKAITHLEIAAKSKEFENDATFMLGKAHQLLYRFDKAIELFKQYKELMNNSPAAEMEEADREIEICHYARELMKVPVKVHFENLGKNVNSEYADYYPLVTGDESDLFFTTRRKGTTGGFQITNDLYTSDVFRSSSKGGEWSKAKSAGSPFNSPGEDEATSVSSNGEYVIIYTETEIEIGDIMIAVKSGKSYKQRIPLEKPINTEKMEAAGSVTSDGNTIVFSSDRAGGEGEFDLYITKRLPTGAWGEPVNLGPKINTKYIEDFPMISDDGKTLYFCSQGHVNMGGFDVFKSTFDEEKNEWNKPINIGYPLNTPDDDMAITFTADGRQAYVSAFREDGLGDLDIYRITFDDIEPKYTIISGIINIEKIPDNSITLNVYKKDNITKEFPTTINPGTTWEFVETKKKEKVPDTEINYVIFCTKDGKNFSFSLEKYPQGDESYEIIDIKAFEKKIPSANKTKEPIKEPVSTDRITLVNKTKNTIYGNYKTIGETGRFIIIVPPGKFELKIEQEGYETYKEIITVKEMGIENREINKDITLKKAN